MSTFIYVTHDQIEAMTLGTRVAVIYKGKVVQFSPPKELYNKPHNLFVAAFVGSPEMNFIHGHLIYKNGSTQFESMGLSFLTANKGNEARKRLGQETTEAVLGVRPESVCLGSLSDPFAIPFNIITIEPFGQSTFVRLRSANNIDITSLVGPDLPIKEGETVGVTFNPESVHYFNKETGQNCLL